MTGTGRAMVNTPAIAHSEPMILPQTPTGLKCGTKKHIFESELAQPFSSALDCRVLKRPISSALDCRVLKVG